MIPGFLAARLGAVATTLGLGGIREGAETDKRLDIAAMAKGGMRIIAPMALLAGMIWALHAAAGHLPPRDPMLLRQTVAFPEFGVQVVFPYTWSVNYSRGGTHLAARDATTGAVLSGEIAVTEPRKPLATDIDRIVEQQRARLGPESKSSRGVMALGLLYAEWVELSYAGLGNPLYI